MFQHYKKTAIVGLLMLVLIVSGWFRHPSDTGRQILRYFVIGNTIFILFMSGFLHFFFWYRNRKIVKMLDYIAAAYDTPLLHSYTPVTLIKKRLYKTSEKSYLKKEKKKSNTRSSFTIVHDNKEYDFVHHLDDEGSIDLASILIYFLQRDVPYEILYEQSKHIHTILQ